MRRTMIVLVLVLVAAAACGSDDEPLSAGDDPGTGGAGSLGIQDPGEYRSVEVTEDGEAKAMVDDATIALRFSDGRVSANAGCNQLGAGYSVDDGTLRVEDVSMTQMGCDPAAHDQDEWLADFLASAPAVEPSQDGFTLATERTSVRFVDREVAEPDAALVGTTWTVTGFVDGDTAMAMAPPRDGRDGTLRFEENGFVTGFDGCNDVGYAEGAAPDDDASDLGLTYDVDGDRISFEGSAVQTLVGCDSEYTERFHAVLSGTVGWEIEASTLTLLADDGRGVTFTAEG